MRVIACDNTPGLLWGFGVSYGLGVGLGVSVLLRDGPPVGVATTYAYAVMGVFVSAALSLARYVARLPCSRLTLLDDGRVQVVLRYPFRRIAAEVEPCAIPPAVAMPTDAKELDDHWCTSLAIGDPLPVAVVVAQGRRARCERVRDTVIALGHSAQEAPHEA